MNSILKYLFCLIFFGCVIIPAQEDSPDQKAADLFEKGQEAFHNQEYQQAIDTYLEALNYIEMKEWRASVLYNISCSYSLLGEAEKALAYLDSSVNSGLTDYSWIGLDTDLEFLRQNYPEEIKHLIASAKSAKMDEIRKLTPIDVVEYDNYDGDTLEADWGDISRPEMDTLRDRYQLHSVIEKGATELDKMKLLLAWVTSRWQHDGTKMAPERTALAILREVEKGKRFCCANYADVFDDCMNALGYPTRFVGLRQDDIAYARGAGHGCIEVWSNQYQKWIVLDAQNDAWWELDGRPLNADECHQLLVNGREKELEFVGPEGRRDDLQKAEWCQYFYHVAYGVAGGGSLTLVTDTVLPELIFQGRFEVTEFTDDYDRVYPRLNQTKISFRHDPDRPLDSLDVILAHTMPYFDKFLVRIDQSEWTETEAGFQWALHEGINTIEAKAVNAAGVEGRTSRIVLQDNLGSEKQ